MRKPVILGMSILMALCSLATAANLAVPSTYPTIQAAIDAAAAGDSVVVSPGTYTGAGNRDISFKGKAITVRSLLGPATCIIDCGGLGRGFLFETNEKNTSVLQGLTIKNGKAVFGGAIECYLASPSIRDCIITNNTAEYGGGIDCYQAAPAIFNCVFQNNTAHNSNNSGEGGGIELDASSPSVINCLFQGNTTDEYGIAIDCFFGSKPVITNCTFIQNQSASPLAAAVCADAVSALAKVVNSVLWDNSKDISGVLVEYSCVKDGTTGTGVINTDPLFRTGPKGNFYLSQIAAGQLIDSPCLNTGNPASNLTTLGINTMSTRTDNVADSGQADMGYHYPGGAVPVQVPLTIQMIPLGGIKPATILPAEGTANYAQYSDITITVTPNLGYKVKKWTGTNDDASVGNSKVVTVTVAKTVTVEFQTHPTFTLTTQIAVGQGTLLPITGLHNSGDVINLKATASAGFRVGAWTGTDNDEQFFGLVDATVLVDKDKTVTVAFVSATISRLDVRVIGGHGTVTPRRGDFPVNTTVNLEARPDPGYRVRQWTGTDDDASKLNTNTITLAYDSIVTVEFEKAPRFWLQTEVYSADGQVHGTLTPASGWIELNLDQTPKVIDLTATPDAGWEVDKWSFDNVVDETAPGVPNTALTNTVTMDDDHRVVVMFREIDPNPWVDGEIRLNGDPAQVFGTIQEAIDAAVAGDEVVVGKGTYSGDGNINLVFTDGKAITVRSLTGPADTIIDCQGAGRGFFFRYNETAMSVVSGFTIRNGVAPTGDDVPGSGRGGGIYMMADCEATVDNCIFENCRAEVVGGAVCFGGADTIAAVAPTGNPGDPDYDPGDPGVENVAALIPVASLVNCTIRNCSSLTLGGGVYIEEAAPLFLHTQIEGCSSGDMGGAIYTLGIADQQTHPVFANCLIVQNQAGGLGGAILAENSSPGIVACTIANNNGAVDPEDPALGRAGGIVALTDTSVPDITECILYRNGDDLRGCSATYSCIPARTYDSVGQGNVFDDPQFIAGPLGRYYLSQELGNQPTAQWSQCVDAGFETWPFAGYTTAVTDAPDAGMLDLGYHYPTTPVIQIPVRWKFKLYPSENGSVWFQVQDNAGRVPMEEGTVMPDSETVVRYLPDWTVVNLKGTGFPGYRISAWSGTDNDQSTATRNRVSLTRDREVRVTFETRSTETTRVLVVPDIYATIEQAVETAKDGDIIVVSPGIHYIDSPTGVDFGGKQIKLISTDPANPAVVAATIIDCQGTDQFPKRAFYFHNGETREALVAGFTIRRGWYNGGVGNFAPGYIWPGLPPDYTPNLQAPDPLIGSRDSGGNWTGDGFGGAVLCEDISSPTFQYCVFSQNTITGGQGRNGLVGGTIFDTQNRGHSQPGSHGGTGTGNGHGGAIACLTGSSPLVGYCTFTDNYARGGCGGDGGDAGPLSIDNPGNENRGGNGGNGIGIGRGGALYADGGSEPVVVECEFLGNIATEGLKGFGGAMTSGSSWGSGGGINWNASDGDDGNVQATGGTIAGGAVYFGNMSLVDFSYCRFIGNKAFENSVSGLWVNRDFPPSVESYVRTLAGAVYIGLGNGVDVRDCIFEGNLGGAMYFEGDDTIQLQRCAFRENGSALPVVTNTLLPNQQPLYQNGPAGALSIGSGCPSVTVTDCQFAENFTFSDGGAVYAYSSSLFERCRFGGNRANGFGGAIFSDSQYLQAGAPIPVLTLNQSDFYENEATQGGAAYLYITQANLNGCNIFNNMSENGGGLFLGYTWVNQAGGIVAGNSAVAFDALGGGIACVDTMLNLSDCILQSNRVEGSDAYGGALGIYASDTRTRQTVKNCLFADNAATNGGGAVSVRIFSVPEFSNCTFANNQASQGGAVYSDWTSKPTLVNSIFSGNHPQAIYEQPIGYDALPGGDSVVSFSLFHNNKVDLYDGQTKQGYTGAAAVNAIGSNHDNLDGDPQFAAGILGAFYLNPTSPAVDRGDGTAELTGLAARTTRIDNVFDSGVVDLGYHYIGMAGVPTVTLSVSAIGGHGQVTPGAGTYFQGQAVVLTATPDFGYRVTQWGGGTINDRSDNVINIVVMDTSKQVTIQFEQPRILVVGSTGPYTSIQRAIDDAKEGDTVLIQPGRYEEKPASQEYPFDLLMFNGKTITLSGLNPSNPQTVADTVLVGYDMYLVGVGKNSVIQGLTIEDARMTLVQSDIAIRNVNFIDCTFRGSDGYDGDDDQVASDGENGFAVFGGAMSLFNSSPKLINCRFENCSATGGNGGLGSNGNDPGHRNGYDGGWAGRAYGGAIYMSYASKPTLINCDFINCSVQGGNGGNGGNAVDANRDYGGRGGSWVWAKTYEDGYFYWWDGWQYGNRYSVSGFDSLYNGMGYAPAYNYGYSWEQFAKWFGLEQYSGWNDWRTSFRYDGYDPAYDEYWRYSGYGGAVYCEFDSQPTFVGCRFSGNVSNGGLSGIGGTGAQDTDYVWPNQALNIETGGGALFATRGCKVTMLNCLLRGNSADSTTVALNDDPYISFGGGVAYTDESVVKAIGCTFDNNQAAIGGAIYWNESDLEIADCNLVSNSAYQGAALYSAYSTALIRGASVTNNLAMYNPNTIINPQPGQPSPIPDLPNPIASGHGGGYFALATPAIIEDSVFEQNRATGSGGGLYVVGSDEDIFAAPTLNNCLIVRNVAANEGGGLAGAWYAEPSLLNCTVADNTVTDPEGQGGGVYVGYSSNGTITNSIVWDNVARNGSQIAVSSGGKYTEMPSSMAVRYSDILFYEDASQFLPPDSSMKAIRPGFNAYSLGANDDLSSDLVFVGFPIDFFGNVYDSLYINNNGNVTFDMPMFDFTPFGLTTDIGTAIVAPFFADVDTRAAGSDVVTWAYGAGLVDGRDAFGVNWVDVGYFFAHGDKLNSFQLVIIDRSDRNPGDFDMEFNYGQIRWETGDASMGIDGFGGESARVGYSNGTGNAGTFFEMEGSGVNSYFLDTSATGLVHGRRNSQVLGRYVFRVINGRPEMPGTAMFVEKDSVLQGWDAQKLTWLEDLHNINADPLFMAGYYLSQVASGQKKDSPAINVGSDKASVIGLIDPYTTRTDGVGEQPDSVVDMGYHYLEAAPRVKLTLTIVGDGWGTVAYEPITGLYDPMTETYQFPVGTIVKLTATPKPGYRVRRWVGSDDKRTYLWHSTTAEVTMDQSRVVELEFEPDVVRTLTVPEVYATIEDALVVASGGDTIVLAPGVHYTTSPEGMDFAGRNIHLISTDPDDPQTIATTIIDCQGARFSRKRAFHFHNGETSESLISGVTIVNAFWAGDVGLTGVVFPTAMWPGTIPPNINPPDGPVVRAFYGQDARGFGFGGAILCEDGSSPTITNCVFRNCTALGAWAGDGGAGGTWQPGGHSQPGGHGGIAAGNGFGGAIACIRGSSPDLRNCTFENNHARGAIGGNGGAAGPADGGHEGDGGDGGDALGYAQGGAVYCDGQSNPLIQDCVFTNNYTASPIPGLGGRMATGSAWGGTPPWIAADGLSGLYTSYGRVSGGALGFGMNSNVRVIRCVFTENKAYDELRDVNYYVYRQDLNTVETYLNTRGGAIFSDPNNTILLEDSQFQDNLGGAVYLSATSDVSVKNCKFTGNGSPTNADMFQPYYNYGLYDVFANTDSTAAMDSPSGALYIGPKARKVRVESTEFFQNFTFGDGGAVTCRSDAEFVKCRFAENTADRFGGGFYSYDPTRDPNDPMIEINLDACSFLSNTAMHGGGLWLREVKVNLTNTYLFTNTADTAGAILLADGDMTMDGGIVRGNQSTADETHGGAILFASATGTLRNLVFENNAAMGENSFGGAVSFYGSDARDIQRIENCLLTGNLATAGGGAIACRIFTEAQIRNCTFVGNDGGQFGGAVFCDWSSNPKIVDSIFSGNTPEAVYEEQIGGDSQILYSLFYANPRDLFDAKTGLGYTGAAALNALGSNANNRDGDPKFAAGPLGANYLGIGSPAIDAGSVMAAAAGLNLRTTRVDNINDLGTVDVGYHYANAIGMAKYQLTASVDGGHGLVQPVTGSYYAGTPVTLTAIPDNGYMVDHWGGGTANDQTRELTNLVIMDSDKQVTVRFFQPRILMVGSGTQFTSVQHAIQAAQDGDIILIKPGQNVPAYPYGMINFLGKDITLSGMNPDDPASVAATVLDGYDFYIYNVGSRSVVEGLTIRTGRFYLVNSQLTIRNCRFEGTHWLGADGIDGFPCDRGPSDGYNGVSVYGGALEMYHSSPKIQNCRFENLSVTGGDGGRGSDFCPTHLDGWDGGWAGRAYGGAVYMAFGSNPSFESCQFINCFVQGGNGGDGGNGDTPNGWYGGRGGNWVWPDFIEQSAFYWWDGWEWGDRDIEYYYSWTPLLYDWKRWSHWFGYDDYRDWQDWLTRWVYSPFVNPYEEYWRYSGYGGAVYCDFDSKATFTTCHFENNRSFGGVSGIGGDGYNSPARWPERNLNIENGGGALFATRGSKVDLVECLFRNNSADSSTLNNATPPVDTFDDFYVSFGGGVAATQESVVRMSKCTFESNQAAIGGGLYWGDSEVEVADCNFIANSAYHGGGLYSADGTGSIVGLHATMNLAAVDPAILASQTDPSAQPGLTPIILPNLPHMVTFGEGGGYFCLSSDVEIRDSIFKKNRAAGSGGGIYYVGSNPDVTIYTTLHNSLFSGNIAGRDGGGVSVDWYSRVKISNSTLSENTVTGSAGDGPGFGGGLYVSYGSDVDVLNSIIWDNVSVEGAQLAVGSGNEFGPRPSTVRIHYTDIGPEFDPNAIMELTDPGSIIPMPPRGAGNTAAVTDLANLQQQLTGGSMAKVIVLLQQPIELRKALDWNNPFTVQAYRTEVQQRITTALSDLQPGEFVVKYRYENIAAFSGSVTQAGLDRLVNLNLVASIEPVREVFPMLRQAIPLANALQARQEYDGTGTSIAIVDSGIDYRHPMLGGGGFPNAKVIGGYDVGDNDANPMPSDEAHGTNCAGIAAGDLGDIGDYIGGVAPGARLYALKLTGDDGSWANDAGLRAWDWCITHQNDDPANPILVMSNSWGRPGIPFADHATADAFAPTYTQMAALAVERGITIMAASGNDGFAGQGISWPSAMSNVISVGAVYDTTDLVTGYSDSAELLDILAPADPVYSTDIVGAGGYDPGDYFPYFNGTSSACPFAAGCVADIQNAARIHLGRYLLPEEVRRLLIRTGDPVTDTKVAITKPRVNLGMAIAGIMPPKPIYVEPGAVLVGWDDPTQTWSADTFNFMEDPDFVGEYFLSEIAAGQLQDSPCLNAGSNQASTFGLDKYTTRSDSVLDAGLVNLGYHHLPFEPNYVRLRTTVYASGLDSLYGYHPTITPYDPEGIVVMQYTQFELQIQPEPPVGYEVLWTGTDNDRIVTTRNVVTVDRNKSVMAEFVKVSFQLDTEVTVDPDLLPGFIATITPPSGLFKPLTRVKLTVTPPPAGFQVRWSGTDKDGSVDPINYVTMKRDTKVEAWYEKIEIKYYAILCGINDVGGGYPVLQYAEADASQVYSKLLQMPEWKTENIHILLGQDATLDRMRLAVLDLRQRMDPDDVFMFYFAGHGFASPDALPIDEFDGFDENLFLAGQEALSDDQVAKWIASLPTHKYAVFLDTGFHSGSTQQFFTPRGLGINIPKPGDDFGIDLIPHQTLLKDGTAYMADPNGLGVVVTAAQGDQNAWEYPELGHGLFTYFLLKAIDGWADHAGNKNGWTSGEECFTYVSRSMAAWLKDWDEIGALPVGFKQQPSMYDASTALETEFASTPSQGSEPRTFYIPGSADSIQQVIDVARDGDLIVLSANTYRGGLTIDKNVTITSANPDDPEVVAATIIDCSNTVNRGVYFTRNAGPGAVLNGITLQNGVWTALPPDAGTYDGRSIGGGGVLVGYQSSPTIKNCVIRGFRLIGGNAVAGPGPDGDDGGFALGAGIYCALESAPTIINTTITDCHVVGGNATSGVSASAGNPTATPPVPASPLSGRGGWGGGARGGGVYIAPMSMAVLRNCTISNCSATGGNGGNGGNFARLNGVDVPGSYGGLWSDSSYAPWQAWGYVGDYRYYAGSGAGVYCEIESEPKFIECLIQGNQTRGGMSGQGGTMPAGQDRRQPITPFELPSYGGGVFCGEMVKAEFVKCRLSGNIAPKPSTNFTLNSSLGHGGGIAFERSASIVFDTCQFDRNDASVGAGMYYLEDTPVIADCNFLANNAYQGGGIFADGGAGTIDNTEFLGNLAGVITNTGGVISIAPDILGQGGAIASVTAALQVRNSRMINNFASTSGAGVFFSGLTDGSTFSPSMSNVLVAENLSGRDGGGVSANWGTRLKMSNCTIAFNQATGLFGLNPDDGLGGGLYTAYDSEVEVINSIFWANSAARGSQIVVGSGYEFDPRPSTVTVSYTDISGGWSESFVLVEDGCTLVQGPGNLISGPLNPIFVQGPFGKYYLSQSAAGQSVQSPCINRGSASASSVGMNFFTTRTDKGPDNFDSGTVDLGFHYPLTRGVAVCRNSDLPFNGRNGQINLADFAVLASSWLSPQPCTSPGWCQGADINRDTRVNITDLLSFTSCWMTTDTLAPRPNPAEWGTRRVEIDVPGGLPGQKMVVLLDGKPTPGASSTEIIMTAAKATDDWAWPVAYQFECVKIDNQAASVKSPWLYFPDNVEPTWTATGLQAQMTYAYVVRVAEIRVPGTLAEAGIAVNPTGSTALDATHVKYISRTQPYNSNWTADSRIASTRTGLENNPPAPIAWEVQPFQNTVNSVSMTAADAIDQNPPVTYIFMRYRNAADQVVETTFNAGQTRTWVDTNVQIGQTWTYSFVALDNLGNKSAPAPRVTVTLAPPDTNPPLPDPLTWDIQPVRQFAGGQWYDFMQTSVAVDPEGTVVEYQIIETGSGTVTPWRTAAIPVEPAPDGVTTYPGNAFWILSDGHYSEKSYQCRARDSSLTPNTTAWSTPALEPYNP